MEYVRKEEKLILTTVESYTICDKCGEKIKSDDMYDVFECSFIYKTGTAYPEGGDGDKVTLDLCQKCGKEAIELLEEAGFNTQNQQWNY